MGIASFSGASSVIKPGVVTSSTRPSSPFVGQLIYETDTARLAAYNGSAWVTQNALQLVKTQTIGTTVSSVTVSDAFSSTYENYLITLNGGSATTAMDLNLTLGSTATGYYWGILFRTYAGVSSGASGSNTTSFLFGSGQTATLVANCTVSSPNLAKNTNFVTHYGGGGSTSAGSICGGFLADTTQYTAFTITTSTGTITGGTIRVYGYANS